MERTASMSEISVDSRDLLSGDLPSRTSKKRAKVWEYVELETIDGKEKAVCKYCKMKLSCEHGQGTNHLNRHIGLHCHNIPHEDRERFLVSCKRQAVDGDQSLFDPQVCRALIAKFFISVEIAFRKADDPYWKKLLNYFHPSFVVVGRQTIRSDCLALYEEEKKRLLDSVKKLVSHVNLTADLWTSNQNLGYLCVTAHYIDEGFKLHKVIISFKQTSYPHTSYAVQDAITSCLVEWDLISKLFTLTLDNASVNDKAAKDLRDTLGAEMFLRAGDLHVRCAAHVLNIMVQDGLKVVVHAIGRVRDIVKTVTSSPSRMQIFNSVVERLGLKTKSGLVLDVPHRWNVTYDMIHEALEYKIALNRYATEQYHEAPTEGDWEKAQALHGFLQAFSDATKAFSADRHPTAHLLLKLVLAIRDVLLDERWNQDELLKEMARVMYVKFEKYWSKPNVVLLIATVLDPSQKFDFLRFYFHTIEQDVEEKMRELRTSVGKYYSEYEKIVRSRALPTFVQSDEHMVASESSSLGGAFFGKRRIELAFAQFSSQNLEAHAQLSELDTYLQDPRAPLNSDDNFDVLGWWKRNIDVYPILSLMARDFLAIPVSTVSSESAFSAAGRLIGKNRTSLSPKSLEALICSKDWFIGFNDDDDDGGEAMEAYSACELQEDISRVAQ